MMETTQLKPTRCILPENKVYQISQNYQTYLFLSTELPDFT